MQEYWTRMVKESRQMMSLVKPANCAADRPAQWWFQASSVVYTKCSATPLKFVHEDWQPELDCAWGMMPDNLVLLPSKYVTPVSSPSAASPSSWREEGRLRANSRSTCDMELLHRISAQAARGGLRLCKFSDGGCVAEIAASRRAGSVCRMSGGGEGSGPARYRPRQSSKLSKQVSRGDDDGDGSRKIGLHHTDDIFLQKSAEEPEKQFEGPGTVGRRTRRPHSEQGLPHQSLPVSDSAALTKSTYSKPRRVKQEQNASSSRKDPFLLHLTYADGRQVETTFNDGRSIFYADNDEVKIVHEKKPAVLAGNGLDHSKLDDMEDMGSDTPLVESKQFGKDEIAVAKRYALSLLAAAPQPVAKLRKKLSGKNVSSPVIEETILDLQRSGLQSDREYAELFARSRWRSFSWGPARIKLELRGRGLGQEDIEMATKRVFETVDFEENATDGDQDVELNNWGMTAQAKERLLKQASRQWQKGGPGVSNEARQRRMIGWLQRRGFKWSIVTDVLKSLGGQQKYDLDFLEED